MVLREVPGFAAQFGVYEYLKGLMITEQRPHLSLLESFAVCAPAAVICWIFSYPQDIIKTKLQTQPRGTFKKWIIPDGGFVECGRSIYRSQGIRGFFVGISPCLIRASYSDAVGIVVYEKCRESLWSYRNH